MLFLYFLFYLKETLHPGLNKDFYEKKLYIHFSLIQVSDDCYLQAEAIRKVKAEVVYSETNDEAKYKISGKVEVLRSMHIKLDAARCGSYASKMLSSANYDEKVGLLKEIIKEHFDLKSMDRRSSGQLLVFSFVFSYVNGKFSPKDPEIYVWCPGRSPDLTDQKKILEGSMQIQERLSQFKAFYRGLRKRTLVKYVVWTCKETTKNSSEICFSGKFLVKSLFSNNTGCDFSIYYKLSPGEFFGRMNRRRFREWITEVAN